MTEGVYHKSPSCLINRLFGGCSKSIREEIPAFKEKKTEFYQLIASQQFERALLYLEDFKNLSPEALRDEFFKAFEGKNVIHLILGAPSTCDSERLLGEIIALSKEKKIEDRFKECGPFSYALSQRQEGHFRYLLEKHRTFLNEEQIAACFKIIATSNAYIEAYKLLLPHVGGQKERYILCDGSLDSPFITAIRMQSESIARCFIESVSFLNCRFGRDRMTVLHYLVNVEKDHYFNTLCSLKPQEVAALVDEQDAQGETALYKAARGNHSVLVDKLLACGADYTLPSRGKTPYEVAKKIACWVSPSKQKLWDAEHGLSDVHPNLVPELKDKIKQRREAAFLKDCQEGYFDLAQTLVRDKGVDVNVCDPNGNNALLLALQSKQLVPLPFVEFLLAKGLQLKHLNNSQDNALTLAAKKMSFSLVELLLKKNQELGNGLDLNHTNIKGESLLTLSKSQEDILLLLVTKYKESIDLNKNGAGFEVIQALLLTIARLQYEVSTSSSTSEVDFGY